MPHLLGVDVTAVDSTAQHELGSRHELRDGSEYVYVEAGGALAAEDVVTYDVDYSATALAAAGNALAVCVTAIGSGSFGWVQVSGSVTASTATGVSAADPISLVTDASGDFVAPIDIDEAGVDTAAPGTLAVRGVALDDEATGSAPILLFRI